MTLKSIAVICNYEIREDRIGGMDRFFEAFDTKAKTQGYTIHWFFKGEKVIDFYKGLDITLTQTASVESLFLNDLKKDTRSYDYVITHFTELCAPFYKAVKLKTNACCIAVDHNPRPLEGFPLKKRLKLRLKGMLYSRYIDFFIGVSSYCLDHLVKEYGNSIRRKCLVIYNGILADIYIKKSRLTNTPKFIIACHLRKEKGVQDVINALALVDKNLLRKFKLDVYGEGPYEHYLKLLVADLNLEEYVKFRGSRNDLHLLYHNYDYLIHASHGETFCFTVVESLVSNLRVITTKGAGNILGLVKDGENGYTFNIMGINELSNIIVDILKNEESMNELKTNQEMIDKFSTERMVDGYLNLLS
ncbi:glycosyltransferase involved in cell wall biosynthesis [Gelidibacter algens]|uniref:Glycosyltransferase involved in cell wall biosynthesis n=1 Tax=Gelidibacter algens TaxID=49280 RepID=A0A327S8W7_9FLAO|nr:glycosyltransferase family 4 protein [Gelidibacter algens]RAJ25218.1 glycosyltransferase involved in cell wall biosynthesis [Gelidibacter algens]